MRMNFTGIRAVLFVIVVCYGLNVSAQYTLPEKNAVSLGGAITLPIGSGENDFTDIHQNTACFTANANFRHFLSPQAALGAIYQFYGTHSGKDLFRCHFIAPTITFRSLQDDAKQSLYATFGIGYFHYADRIFSRAKANHTFNHGYLGASLSIGYEWAVSKSFSTQLHLDFISAKWAENENYEPKWMRDNPDEPEYMFEPKMVFVSLGLDVQFGR
jgi:hypothetical protein